MSIRRRLILVFVLVAGLAFVGLFRWAQSEMLPRYMEAQEDILVDLSQLLAVQIEQMAVSLQDGAAIIDVAEIEPLFASLSAREFEAQIYSLLKSRVEIRVYVTDDQGIVVFDSDNDRDLGRDNSQWRDINRTLKGEYGARSTHGDPLFPDESTMYVAAPISYRGDLLGVVSVGKTTRNAVGFLQVAMRDFAVAAGLVLLLASSLAWILYLWVTRPLARLEAFAQNMQSGERVPVPALGAPEIQRVGEAIDNLRGALDGKAYIEHYVQELTHELKSPVAAIRGAAELLDEDMPPVDQQRFLGNIQSESSRLAGIVDRMLELAGLENLHALSQASRLDLVASLREAIDSLAPQMQRAGLRCELQTPPDAHIQGDAFLVQRALVNVLANAVDFSPEGGEIQIRLSKTGDEYCLRVCDAGSGLPAYAADRVFDRFYSLPRKNGRKGTGLGLSFVKQIMALHGGSVELHSRFDQVGCQASLWFPMDDA